MNSRLKQIATAVKLSAKFTSSAWRTNKILSELTAGPRAESFNRPPVILSNDDENKDSLVGMSENSTVVDETSTSSWSEATAKLIAERINRPQIILSDEEEDEDSLMGMDESSMVVDETNNFSWSEETAKLRAEKINHPQIMLSDEDEDEGNSVSMDESSMAVDETHISSSSSSSSVSEKYSKFERPSSVQWTKENANSVSLIGSICHCIRFKYTSSGKRLVWTSLNIWDEIFCSWGSVGLYFLDELADLARQHLKINDYVHVSGELKQQRDNRQHNIWVMVKDLKFVQCPSTPNTGAVRKEIEEKTDRVTGHTKQISLDQFI